MRYRHSDDASFTSGHSGDRSIHRTLLVASNRGVGGDRGGVPFDACERSSHPTFVIERHVMSSTVTFTQCCIPQPSRQALR